VLRRSANVGLIIASLVLAAVFGARHGGSSARDPVIRDVSDASSYPFARVMPDDDRSGGPAQPVRTLLPVPVAGAKPGATLPEKVAVPERTANVRDYGAVGDGRTDDSSAIQRANDAMAGGGRVIFPRGIYLAVGVVQDSFVEFVGEKGASIRHLDATHGGDMIQSRVVAMAGSIAKGSAVLEVSGAKPIPPGVVVAVRGAGGGSSTQYSELSIPTTTTDTNLSVRRGFGFSTGTTYSTNFLLVGDEIMSYRWLSSGRFSGVVRGLLGTRAVVHPRGTRVAQLGVLYANVVSSRVGRVVLDRPARLTVRGATVSVGSVGMAVRNLTLDGGRPPGSLPNANPMPIAYSLASSAAVTGCTIRNGDHGAVSFDKGTVRSVIADNVLLDNGAPSGDLGSAIWLFRGSSRNVVSGNTIAGDTNDGITIDDRTVASTEWDADPMQNVIERNTLDIRSATSNVSIWVLGGSRNTVRSNAVAGTRSGIRIYTGGQSAVPPATSHNVVSSNTLRRLEVGLWTNGSHNRFIGNRQFDVRREFVDEGRSNEFG
jgi:hypothetical protein